MGESWRFVDGAFWGGWVVKAEYLGSMGIASLNMEGV